MSNQPYEPRFEPPHEGHDPYQQPQQPQQQADWQQHTQQWEGQTWETQVQPTTPAADAAYVPPRTSEGRQAPQGHQQASQGYAEPQGSGHPQNSGHQGSGHAQVSGRPQGNGYAQGTPHAQAYGYGAAARPVPQEPAAQGWDHARPQQHPEASSAPMAGSAAPAAGVAPGAEAASGYGPATVTGNARVTDAQRARAEGRSPVIEPGIQPAALTAALALLLAGTAAIGEYALVVPLVLLQAVTAAGWFRLNGMWPARQGIALAFLGAVTADVVLLAAGRENAPAAILGTLGVWVLLTLVLQLRSHADPDTRMYGLMATVVSAALSVIAAGHLAAEPDAVTVGAAAVAVAILVRALPLPTAVSVVVALLAATGAGFVVGGMTDLGGRGAFLGLGAGVCALIGHRVASYDYPSRFVHFTAGVALPLAAAAPAVYLLGRALG
ncbi:hypothetical protein GFH48_22015 [Streptomyces fagopyri]|uniref:Uncharacterized protein n=1 Tax=Streptomyces fagopyri TaxID=2662397 RepID=A0A5Q0LEZ0_9ACTN|nr:hypothetical protein [Streptomyces fagopyri]QFZ75580.1 hypothetical protein GFH48_22015 [Streptomyces fagopyri]